MDSGGARKSVPGKSSKCPLEMFPDVPLPQSSADARGGGTRAQKVTGTLLPLAFVLLGKRPGHLLHLMKKSHVLPSLQDRSD